MSSTMRVLVVRNPSAGTSRKGTFLEALTRELTAEGATVETVTPSSTEETRAVAAGAKRSSYEVLVAAGGDGTLSAVVNGLVRSPREERPALAILPLGRGNDFASELNLGSPAKAIAALARGERKRVDLGRTEAGVFVGIAGAGFDARTARNAQKTPYLSGAMLYTVALVRTLADWRPLEARVRFESGTYEGPITFAAVGNSRRYGGGMLITPRAELTDGRLDLCLVRDLSRVTLLSVFPSVFSGQHLSHPKVDYHRSSFVEIATSEPAEVFADGEFLQKTPVRIDVLPKELEVISG